MNFLFADPTENSKLSFRVTSHIVSFTAVIWVVMRYSPRRNVAWGTTQISDVTNKVTLTIRSDRNAYDRLQSVSFKTAGFWVEFSNTVLACTSISLEFDLSPHGYVPKRNGNRVIP